VVLEGRPGFGGQSAAVAMQMAHQTALDVICHPVAEDQIMHAATDVDRVNLDVTVVGEGGGYVGHRRIEQQEPAHKPAGSDGIETEGTHAKTRQRMATKSTKDAK
jgi:hypothetical protein